MSLFSKELDAAFLGAGAKPGLEIWCIENQQLVPVPRSCHGKFSTGSGYIVLNTVFPKSGPPQHDIHYWLGNDTTQVDSGLASYKALELDAALGSCCAQYREMQGLESEKFLSYFRPCIIPIDRVYSSKLGNQNGEYRASLFTCKGDHVAYVKEVPLSRSSLNHSDVFILDTALKIFLFSGCNSTVQERAKALEVVQYIKENKHSGNCNMVTIEDGKFVGDPDVGEFWSLFGGYAPIPRDLPSSVEQQLEAPSVTLFWVNLQGKICQIGSNALNKEMLESNKCYMLDCNDEIFVWMGRKTSVTERKSSVLAIEDFLRNQGRSNTTRLSVLSQGLENTKFRSYFGIWPKSSESKLYEEGREKVAAIFKQQGYDVKELPEEENEQLLDSRGTLKVWRVNCDELSPLSVSEQTNLYSGDCYIMQFAYSTHGKAENLHYAWLGSNSVKEDKADAISQMHSMVDSMRGNTVMARVIQDNEPLLLLLILQRLVIFKGGLSTRYKKFIGEECIVDETYDANKVALFRVQGTRPDNMQAIQVDEVATSLNSSYCYILQTGASIYTWIGSLSLSQDHDILDRILKLLNPACQPISVREGNEPDTFWNVLGGKSEYPKEKEIQQNIEDPHLFLLNLTEVDLKVKEIYSFTQDDLTTEDVFVLDCQREIYVWIGSNSSVRSKQEALNLGLKFLEMDVLVEGLSLATPIYVVTEGHEPSFFTCFFSWDSSKANMHGNSFERKLAILKGKPHLLEVVSASVSGLGMTNQYHDFILRLSCKSYNTLRMNQASNRNVWKTNPRETTPDGLRSNSVTPNGSRSGSPASPYKLSKKQLFSSPTPTISSLAPEPPSSENAGPIQADKNELDGVSLSIYPYEHLKVTSKDPILDIDVTKREAYLSDEEFQEKFCMAKGSFYKLPKWKQNKLKMALDLF